MHARRHSPTVLSGIFVAFFPLVAGAWNPYPDLVNPENPPPVTYTSRPYAARTHMSTHMATLQQTPPPVAAAQPYTSPPVMQQAPPPAVMQQAPPPPASTPPPVVQQAPLPPLNYAPPPVPPRSYTPPPAPVAAAAPAYGATPYTPPPRPALVATYGNQPAATSTAAGSEKHDDRQSGFTVGLESFYDRYQEPSLNLTSRSYYGALTAGYTYFMESPWFVGIDGRASYGAEYYHSPSGNANAIPQMEFAARVRGGYSYWTSIGRFDPYSGLGLRYYRDDFSGHTTDTGNIGYDRRIFQLYVPFGVDYSFQTAEWAFKPNAEFDYLFFGNVSSHLADTGVEPDNIENRQSRGYGLRAELMMAALDMPDIQFGPFIRFWDIPDSHHTTDSIGQVWVEPHNRRIQAGLGVKMGF